MVLLACSEAEQPFVPVVERDPIVVQALNDPLLTDPDLASLNEANAALTDAGGIDRSVPLVIDTPEAIAAAKREAADLVGGSDNLQAELGNPVIRDALPRQTRFDLKELAKATGFAEKCAERAEVTAKWAADMPDAFQIYPRGNTLEAIGADADGCALRVIRYLTPVQREDVLAFYAAQARRAKLPVRHELFGTEQALSGKAGGKAYSVFASRRASGVSEVLLVTYGF